MVYSIDNLYELKKARKKEKQKTFAVSLLALIVLAVLIFVIFRFKLPYLAILGGIISFALFAFLNLRNNFVHKKIKNYIDFYMDIFYGDSEKDLVEFKGELKKVKNGNFDFYEIECYSHKTETQGKILIDCDFDFGFVPEKKYVIKKVGNVLTDYKEND